MNCSLRSTITTFIREILISTSSDAQHILAGSYSSFLQFVLCNHPTAKRDQQNQMSATKIFHKAMTIPKSLTNFTYWEVYVGWRSPILQSSKIISPCSFLFHIISSCSQLVQMRKIRHNKECLLTLNSSMLRTKALPR